MKSLNELVLGMLLFLTNSHVFAGDNIPLPDLEFFENGVRPAETLAMDSSPESELEFSPEGLKVMDFLAKGRS